MKRRTMLAGAAALVASPTVAPSARAQAGKTKLVLWHAMTGANNDEMERIARDFNAAQSAAELQVIFKGTYPDTLTAAIAAWRAGQAPHLVQVFEVGTGTMLGAGPAVKQVWQLQQETGAKIDPAAYLPAVRGYYSLSDGRMASMPLNSSTPVMWYNLDAFAAAGLDPTKPPETWQQFVLAARALKEKWATKSQDLMASTSSWITWAQLECYGAIHNVPYATKANGMDGLDTTLEINGPLQVKHLGNLAEAQKDKSFDYSGRYDSGFGRFTAGECPIMFGSSGSYGNVKGAAKFAWASAPMPYYPDVPGAPQNSIIGGASLWVMGGKKPDEYKGVAKFFSFLSDTDRQAKLHQTTGYMPITKAAYEKSKADGFYDKNPALETPIKELTNKPPTENSRGLRLGNLPQMRDLWAEEIEATLAGKKTPKQALDEAATRGNAMLRQFEKQAGR